MEFKKKINGTNVRFHINEWTWKTVIEVDNESVFSSWEHAIWGLLVGVTTFALGYLYGHVFWIF